uniref:GCF C-terminal domain-containing protein n=1 Tax=Trichobilharzia regenti TaxID=157069 RepID=A0AA85KEV3_TRIRE|nr:unnamed protein product [Trichobilharzia regenti]
MDSYFMKKVRRNYRSKAGDSDEEQGQEPESLYDAAMKEMSSQCKPDNSSIKKNKSVLSFEDDLDPDDGDTFKVKKSSMSRKVSRHTKESKKKKTQENDGVRIVGYCRENLVSYDESSPDPEESLENLRKELLDLNEEETTAEITPSVKPEPTNVTSLIKRIKNDGRRLVREDDDVNEDEDADDDVTVSYSKSASETRPVFVVSKERETVSKRSVIGVRLNRREEELKCIREDFMAAEHASDRDSDQEIEWERQQLQKAMINQNPAVLEAIQPILSSGDSNYGAISKAGTLFAGIDVTNITLSKFKENLEQKYNKLNGSLNEHKTTLEEAKRDLERGKLIIDDARGKLPSLAKRFVFYQQMKEYIDDLISCFNEKMPKIEYMEKRCIILFRERYDKLVERRRMDMKDLAISVSQPNTSSPNNSKTPEEVKNLEARRRRCAERESRRMRRQRGRELQNPGVLQVHIDGTSTDEEESQAVIAKREADIDALLVDANALFEDVVEEFCELPLILERFKEWRVMSPESYKQAYVSLCLPQLFSPIIRIQLIGWNPLINDSNAIEDMKWFQDLLDFCSLPEGDSNDLKPTTSNDGCDGTKNSSNEEKSANFDDDLRVIPKSVEKVVLQLLNELINASWDPLSEKQSSRLVNLMQDLSSTYPTVRIGSRPTEKLFTSIVKRIENTIQEDIFIPLYPKSLMQQRQGTAFLFFERQFNMGLKLLKNILLWSNLLSVETMKHISLTCLVNRYLLVGLACLLSVATSTSNEEKTSVTSTPFTGSDQPGSLAFCDAVQKLQNIVELLPREWLKLSVKIKQENQSSEGTTSTPNPLGQIKRILSQLLECIPPGRMYADISGQLDVQADERDCIRTLYRICDLLKD